MPPVIPSPAFAGPAPDHVDIIVGNPDVAPTGMVRLAANGAGGTAQASVSGGAYAGIGGSGGADPWFSNVANFARTLDATLLATPLASECATMTTDLVAQNGGSGASTAGAGGVLLTSGATAGGLGGWTSRNGITEAPIANCRTSHFAMFTRIFIVALPATYKNTICVVGDQLTGEMGVSLTQAVSGANYTAYVYGTTHNTGIPQDVGAYVTVGFIADGTNVKFYRGLADGTGLALIDTLAQSAAPTNPGQGQGNAQNLGTAAVSSYRIRSVILLTPLGG